MKLVVVLFVASVLVASIDAKRRRRCNSVVDCPCGSQCVSRGAIKVPCRRGSAGRNCVCRKGCNVGNIFIPAGDRNPNTYCNSCFCPQDSARSKGVAFCTRRSWCGMPRGRVYTRNPKCA